VAKLTPRLRLVSRYAAAMLLTVCVVSGVTFVVFQRSLAHELRLRISRDVEQVSEVLAARGIDAFAGAPGRELLEGEAARIAITNADGRVVAGTSAPGKPTLSFHVIVPGGRTYIVDAVAQPSAAESRATRSLGLILLLSPAVALLFAGAAGFYLADRALRPVEEAYERERRFVADAAHELRTPVTFLRLGVEEMRAHPEAVVERQLNDLALEVGRLTKLVQELLELSRLERSRPEQRAATDIRTIVAVVTDRFRPLAEARGLHLRTQISETSSLALASADGVERVLTVFLENAIAHTASGEISVTLRNGQRVFVDVADTGAGIPPDKTADIFEPFVSAGDVRAREDGGAGLGLAIAKRTARAMGAELLVESAVGKGSTFTLALEPA